MVAVRPAAIRIVGGTAIGCTRTGARWTNRTQVNVGLMYSRRLRPTLRWRSNTPPAMPTTSQCNNQILKHLAQTAAQRGRWIGPVLDVACRLPTATAAAASCAGVAAGAAASQLLSAAIACATGSVPGWLVRTLVAQSRAMNMKRIINSMRVCSSRTTRLFGRTGTPS